MEGEQGALGTRTPGLCAALAGVLSTWRCAWLWAVLNVGLLVNMMYDQDWGMVTTRLNSSLQLCIVQAMDVQAGIGGVLDIL